MSRRKYYQSHRQTLFRLLDYIALVSTSQDHTIDEALAFLRQHRTAKAESLDISDAADGNPLDLSWVSDRCGSLLLVSLVLEYLLSSMA